MDHVHFIGIGGAGMAPLANILLENGATITGSDREDNLKIKDLVHKGVPVQIGHQADNVPANTTIVVYSSAVPAGNPERQKANKLGIPQLRRGEFLAKLTRQYRRLGAISGSHGKTSVTAMLVHILCKAGFHPGFLIGASVNGSASSAAGVGQDIFISEVDESDGTHTLVHPYLGIVTNIDNDHSWSLGGEEVLHHNFQKFANQSENLLYRKGIWTSKLLTDHSTARELPALATNFTLGHWHGFQAWNAQLAIEAASYFGVEPAQALEELEDFRGVARRMSEHYASKQLLVYEDYAHHPAELACSIASFRDRFPYHHLRVVFQPHRYARLAKYLPELATELRKADSVIVTPVFAAWSEIGTITGADLAEKSGNHAQYLDKPWSVIAKEALSYTGKKPLLIAVIGAGDIEQIFHWLPRTP